MAICKKKIIINIILSALLIFAVIKPADAELNFKSFETKKVSYMDFFLLKFESLLIRRSQALKKQLFATRVQYSNIGIQVDFDNKKEKISINIYAIMDRIRYTKKNYIPKLSDCSIVKYIHKNEKILHSILFIILAFIIISNGYIYPTQDIKNSLIHENIYVYYAVLIFIIFELKLYLIFFLNLFSKIFLKIFATCLTLIVLEFPYS